MRSLHRREDLALEDTVNQLKFVKVSPVQFVIESLEYNISKSLKRKFFSNNIQSSASILTEKTKKVEIT